MENLFKRLLGQTQGPPTRAAASSSMGDDEKNMNLASLSAAASATPYPSTGALMSTGASATPKGARKRGMNNTRAGEATLLPERESYEDFKLRILNLAINAGDCYKDLTPAFTEGGDDINDAATTTTGASSARVRNALSAEQKKIIFDQLLVYMFDLTSEVATKTLRIDPNAAEKDALKRKVITFFYKNGFDTPPINDTNNVTTSIKNFVEENYFQCPKGRNFKYNLHMSEDDRQKFPQLGIDGINIIYDAAGVLPHNIFLPGSYEIISTPGSYIDPGTKIKNPLESLNVKTSKGIIPDSLRNAPYEYTIDSDILHKYGLSDIVTSIKIGYGGLTKGGKEEPRPQDSFRISFKVNTRDKAKKGEVGSINFNPTSIGSGFGFRLLNSFDQHQIFNSDPKRAAAEYFKGNAQKNKFIYEKHESFKKEIEKDGIENVITNEFIKYLIMKELGDTLQVLWLDVITEDPSYIGASGNPITKENTFVMTGDAMLIARCILNGYNCIYLSGASSTFYLSNVAMETLPLLSEKLPELEPNPEEVIRKREIVPAVRRGVLRTPSAAAAQSMVVDEPHLGFEEDPNPALNAYLAHNYGVINTLIDKGNAEPSFAGKNIWFYLAAYLKHHTDVMYGVLKRNVIVGETIEMFKYNELPEGKLRSSIYTFSKIMNNMPKISAEQFPRNKEIEGKGKKQYVCFKKEYNVLWRKIYPDGTSDIYEGNFHNDELFQSISVGMTPEKKGIFYVKYYNNQIPYPDSLFTNINDTNTILETINPLNKLYKITESDLENAPPNIAYFLHKMETQSSDKDISTKETKIGDLNCYFEEDYIEETGRTPRKRATLATVATPAKQGGGAFQYNERPADYELETYKPYFANPGYATFYTLSRFPRVFLMGYSIMRFLRESFQVRTKEIDTLFKFCGDALDPELSKLLTEVFLHADEPNYHYNVESDEELEKQMEHMATLDKYMYYTIEVVRAVSGGTGLFAEGNMMLMETIGAMLEGYRLVSKKVISKDEVISEEYQDLTIKYRDIFVDVTTVFFRALIQNYNDLADIGKADVVNSISCYEHKIKNAVMSGVDEIMVPLEILIRRKKEEEVEKSEIEMAGPSEMPAPMPVSMTAPVPVPMPVTSATAMMNRGMVMPMNRGIGPETMGNNNENMPKTPPPEREGAMELSTPPRTPQLDLSRFWEENGRPYQKIKSQGLYSRGPRVINAKRAFSRERSARSASGLGDKQPPRSEQGFSRSRRRSLVGRRGDESYERQPIYSTENYNNLGGGGPKTKKRLVKDQLCSQRERTALKPKRTRRKARKERK